MKKIALFTLLLSSLYGDSKIYLGLGYGLYNENLTYENNNYQKVQNDISPDFFGLKVGYGDRAAYAIEFSLDYINNNEELFQANDGAKYGLNIDLLKAFDFNIYVLPFAKVGFGAGVLDSDIDADDGKLYYGSFNAGGGIFIPLNETLDFEVSYDYRYINYEKLQGRSVNDYTSTSHINMFYVGINTRF